MMELQQQQSSHEHNTNNIAAMQPIHLEAVAVAVADTSAAPIDNPLSPLPVMHEAQLEHEEAEEEHKYGDASVPAVIVFLGLGELGKRSHGNANDNDEEEAFEYDDQSSLSCSVQSTSYNDDWCSLKRTAKSADLTSYHCYADDDDNDYNNGDDESSLLSRPTPPKRRRGASYNVVELHSMLHLMKRVLPKCADEWEIIRLVHARIFPDYNRTVSSLKKKFKELCKGTCSSSSPGTTGHAHGGGISGSGVNSRTIADKAREVQDLIAQKPPGFQLILPKASPPPTCTDTLTCKRTSLFHSGVNRVEENHTGNQHHHHDRQSLPEFKVKVPNPLQSSTVTTTTSTVSPPNKNEKIPKYIQIPGSPEAKATTKPVQNPLLNHHITIQNGIGDHDDGNQFDLDGGYEADYDGVESVIIQHPLLAIKKQQQQLDQSNSNRNKPQLVSTTTTTTMYQEDEDSAKVLQVNSQNRGSNKHVIVHGSCAPSQSSPVIIMDHQE